MADELLRARRKTAAVRRTEYSLKQKLEKIDWELDVLAPEIEELEELSVHELPTYEVEA